MTTINQKMFYSIWHFHLVHINVNNHDLIKLSKTTIKIYLKELLKSQEHHVCDLCIKVKQKHHILRQLQQWVIDICKIIYINVVNLITSINYDNLYWYIICMNNYIYVWYVYSMKWKKNTKKMIKHHFEFLKKHIECL